MAAPATAVATISTLGAASSKNLAHEGQRERQRVRHQQQRAHAGDEAPVPAAQPLDREHEVEPDQHQDARGDRARLEQRRSRAFSANW